MNIGRSCNNRRAVRNKILGLEEVFLEGSREIEHIVLVRIAFDASSGFVFI